VVRPTEPDEQSAQFYNGGLASVLVEPPCSPQFSLRSKTDRRSPQRPVRFIAAEVTRSSQVVKSRRNPVCDDSLEAEEIGPVNERLCRGLLHFDRPIPL